MTDKIRNYNELRSALSDEAVLVDFMGWQPAVVAVMTAKEKKHWANKHRAFWRRIEEREAKEAALRAKSWWRRCWYDFWRA